MAFRGGYWRDIRTDGRGQPMWVQRAECARCGHSHSLLPSFALPRRLDAVESVGAVLSAVGEGRSSAQRAAARIDVPYTTARDWVRRFRQRATALAAGFAALAVELGGGEGFVRLLGDPVARALRTLRQAWVAARQRAGPRVLPRWAFAVVISGGSLLATTRDPPWFVIGNRRFMSPVP